MSQTWRHHADWINTRLLGRWLQKATPSRVLKTDLYEEAVGTGQAQWLAARFDAVQGVDVSDEVVAAAERKFPGLIASVADTRQLPFPDEAFGAVVSLSTLDHFEDRASIARSIAEIARVLAPGGTLVLTLDNPANPVIWLRQSLPRPVIDRTGLVPYFCGQTLFPGELEDELERAGFRIESRSFILHCPRVLAVPFARFLDTTKSGMLKGMFSGVLKGCEGLEYLPTRRFTGHFTAVRCSKGP
ncbi:MAG: class I SAM-dependent methyltransferase [Pseudomonadota bacterium]